MYVELWKSIFDWATVVLIAFTVVSGAGALITGDIISKRQEAKLRQFDKDLTDAKTELGKQQERAAKAESQLAGLQNDVINARTAQQKVEVELTKQQERAANAELQLEQLRKDNLELKASLSPRIFKDQDAAGKILSVFAPVNAVIEYLPEMECKRTAGQIALTLHDFAKWNLTSVRANPDATADVTGVIVQVNAAGIVPDDVKRAAAAADALVSELNKTRMLEGTQPI